MPNFDPNAFIDGVDQKIWEKLNTSPDKPLLNRPLKGLYPPGSTYKPFMALAALSSGAKDPTESINDPGYFVLGNHKFRDSSQGGHGQVDMKKSIVVSSDTYYYKLAIGMGVDLIHEHISPFVWKTNWRGSYRRSERNITLLLMETTKTRNAMVTGRNPLNRHRAGV